MWDTVLELLGLLPPHAPPGSNRGSRSVFTGVISHTDIDTHMHIDTHPYTDTHARYTHTHIHTPLTGPGKLEEGRQLKLKAGKGSCFHKILFFRC